MPRVVRAVHLVAMLAASGASIAHAQSVADFYRAKTIEFIVAADIGGGYDLAARVITNHMVRHIPGNPGIVVRNMPGATGVIGTNYLYNNAKRDGTAIGMPTSNVPLEQRLKVISPDGRNIKFDIARMRWVGTPLQEPQVTWVWHTAPVASVADLKTNAILMGATTASADNSTLPLLVNALLGTRMQIVTGYRGQNEIQIAAERGEIQGNNAGVSAVMVNKADWVRDKKVRIVLQFGTERLETLKEVPTVLELASSDFDRTMLRFYALKFAMARPIVLPPEVPADRADALMRAFEATMVDQQYLADAKKIGLDTNWVGSAGMAELARRIEETPQPVVDRLRGFLIRGGGK